MGKNLKIVKLKRLSRNAQFKRVFEPEIGFNDLLDSQEWNQSLVVTSLAGARLAPQL
jgi:hypothetical protein